VKLPIRVELKYGRTSSEDSVRQVLEPTTDELAALLLEMSRYTAIINVYRLDSGEELLQARPRNDSSVKKLLWELYRFDGTSSYEIACHDHMLAVGFLVEWATSAPTGETWFGGYEWEPVRLPLDGQADGVIFEPDSEAIDAVDPQPVARPEVIDPGELLGPVKKAVAEAWTTLGDTGGLAGIYAFGLDRLGEGFLVVVGHRIVEGTLTEMDELFVDVEEANTLISTALEALEAFENNRGIDASAGYQHVVDTTYEVAVTALQELRRAGLFSGVPDVILNVWHRDSEPTDTETVKRCNPAHIASLAAATDLFS
jgi:hypothetical protein